MRLRPSTSSLVVVGMLGVSVASAEGQQADLSAYMGLASNQGDASTAEVSVGHYTYMGVSGTAAFERRGPRRIVTARLGGAVRYFPDLHEFFTLDRSASLGVDAQVSSNSRLRASQSVQYSPYRQFGLSLFPTTADKASLPRLKREFRSPDQLFGKARVDAADQVAALPPYDPEGAATVGQYSYNLGTTIELSRRFKERTGMAVDYGLNVSLTDAARELPISHRAGIRLRHMLSRYSVLKLGTAYRFSRTGYGLTALPTRTLDFDVGIDYNRQLSFSRDTTISFSSGTALVSRDATAYEPGELGRQLVAILAVTASQSLGRYWDAQLGADRNLQYVDGFPDPFYASRIMSRLTGEIGQRFTLVAAADYSTGSSIGSASQTFNGFQAQTQAAYELTRRWSLFGAFFFTENRLSADSLSSLPPGTILRPNQASVQVGLNFRID